MKKALILSLILLPLFFTACATSGGDVIETRDRAASLVEALGGTPPSPSEMVEDPPEEETTVPVLEQEEDIVVEEEPEEAEAATPVPITPDEPSSPAPVAEEPAVVETATESPESEDVVVVEFEDESVAAPEAVYFEPEPLEEAVIPVSGSAEDTTPVFYPPEASSTFLDDPMDPWMIRLMSVLIVVMILFTAASAIRSAYRAPLSRAVSVSLALLFTALAWIISYIVAGESLLYIIYVLLMFTYPIFRSTEKRRRFR